MFVLWSYEYRLTNSDSAGALFRHVGTTCGELCCPARFAVIDYGRTQKSTSAVDRVVKRYPQLSSLRYETEDGDAALGDMNTPWRKAHPHDPLPAVDQTILAAIADGTPRSYPSMYTWFEFQFASRFQDLAATGLLRQQSSKACVAREIQSGITLASNWWTTPMLAL